MKLPTQHTLKPITLKRLNERHYPCGVIWTDKMLGTMVVARNNDSEARQFAEEIIAKGGEMVENVRAVCLHPDDTLEVTWEPTTQS